LADGLTVYGTGAGSVDIVDGSPLLIRAALCGCMATPADTQAACTANPAPIDAFMSSVLPMRSFLPMLGVRSWQSFIKIESTLEGLTSSLGALGSALTPQVPELPWAPTCQGVTFGAKATIYTIKGAADVDGVQVSIRAVVDLNQDRQTGGRLL